MMLTPLPRRSRPSAARCTQYSVTTPNTRKSGLEPPLLSRLAASQKSSAGSNPDFLVFGVVTEYCVHLAADGLLRRGYGVSIIRDAIQSLDEKKGREILGELESRGARLIAAEQALRLIGHDARDRFQLRKTAGK